MQENITTATLRRVARNMASDRPRNIISRPGALVPVVEMPVVRHELIESLLNRSAAEIDRLRSILETIQSACK